nr:SPASM domain-containing protein [Anaerolineae bacterium]
VNILCTVHAANGDRPLEVYRFFRDELGAQFIQFIPIIERATAETLPIANRGWGEDDTEKRALYVQDGHMVTHRSIKPKQFGNFLSEIFDEWVRRDVGQVYVQIFDVSLGNWYGEPGGVCVYQETCGTALALEHNGDLYSCDHFVEPDYLLGNIQETHMIELVASAQQRTFGLDKRDTLPRYCRECEVRFACHGGCPRNRFLKTPDGEPGLNYLCAGYKLFFKHIDEPMRIMSGLLRQNRAPAEIMRWYAMEDAKRAHAFSEARPNDPCPCGSGRRFKQCHGRRRTPSPSG